jgi:flagellar biosynthesis chaperone FliJ
MRNDFKPVHMEDAKKRLSAFLNEAEKKLNKEKEHYREQRRRRSLWQWLKDLFR